MKIHLKNIGVVILAAVLACVPSVLVGRQIPDAPAWYLLLLVPAMALGYGVYPMIAGWVTLAAGRNRADAGRKVAVIVVLVASAIQFAIALNYR
jgi:cytochrome bd-type quinol oxidase subunit 1